MNTNQPIDMEVARRRISLDLRGAVAERNAGLVSNDDMIAEIDRITDRAAGLGICRHRWESDPKFESRVHVTETRGRKPKTHNCQGD